MLTRLLSGDTPRSRPLAAVLVVLVLALAFAPFLFPGTKPLNVAAKICYFIVLVASYDLLIGYTGIVSFAHPKADSFALLAKLHQRGWITGALADPKALHLMLSPVHLEAGDIYLADLEQALSEVGGELGEVRGAYAR